MADGRSHTPRVVDLTQPLGPGTTPWPGSDPLAAWVTGTLEADGFHSRDVRVPEHTGTHLDAPAHFVAGGASVADIPAARLVGEARVIDAAGWVGDDPDATVGIDALGEHEDAHGRIPEGAIALVRTGWDRYLGDPVRYIGDPGPRCPGIDVPLARALVERGAVGVGIDSLGIDPGGLADCPAHHVTLGAGMWHLEGLVGLDLLPPSGALVVVGVPPLVDGSGCPARVLALVPDALS